MDFNQVASNFKLFSKTSSVANQIDPGVNVTAVAATSFAYTKLLLFLVLFGVLMFAYYKKEYLQQFYDSHLNRIIGKLWVFTHMNSNGELASTYVPSNFSLLKWIPIFDKNE